ncbi:MAG: hypothetical protein C5B47_02810 [Verrucomicrobia bacterium]|nr:MAG: hypothetical protein C5B47_02810 [Verrucomicrobiota bacterium]
MDRIDRLHEEGKYVKPLRQRVEDIKNEIEDIRTTALQTSLNSKGSSELKELSSRMLRASDDLDAFTYFIGASQEQRSKGSNLKSNDSLPLIPSDSKQISRTRENSTPPSLAGAGKIHELVTHGYDKLKKINSQIDVLGEGPAKETFKLETAAIEKQLNNIRKTAMSLCLGRKISPAQKRLQSDLKFLSENLEYLQMELSAQKVSNSDTLTAIT